MNEITNVSGWTYAQGTSSGYIMSKKSYHAQNLFVGIYDNLSITASGDFSNGNNLSVAQSLSFNHPVNGKIELY